MVPILSQFYPFYHIKVDIFKVHLNTVLITSNNELKDKMKIKIRVSIRTRYSLLPFIKSKIIERNTKLNICKIIVRPIVVYGAESMIMIRP